MIPLYKQQNVHAVVDDFLLNRNFEFDLIAFVFDEKDLTF